MIQKDVLDRLRYESEGPGIDFKRAQYQLLSKEEDKKSELLKDVLAMANSWRQGDGPAYILIGFQDRAPSPAEVVGLDVHLDDAQLQQFIGSKVKPKLNFSYEEFEYEGKAVGVISIPKQKRPFYVEKSYGRVHSNVVYVRRGSSTAEADPFEIANMRDSDLGRHSSSEVSLRLLDVCGKPLGGEYGPARTAWDFGDISSLPLLKSRHSSFSISLGICNSEYWRELATFIQQKDGAALTRIELHNASCVALTHCKLEVVAFLAGEEVSVLQDFELEPRPSANDLFVGLNLSEQQRRTAMRKELSMEVVGGRNTAVWRIDKLLPGESLTCPHALALFPKVSGDIQIQARFLAADQRPVTFEPSLRVQVENAVADFERLRDLESELEPE